MRHENDHADGTLLGIAFHRLIGLFRRLHGVLLLAVAFGVFVFTMNRGVATENDQHELETAAAAVPKNEEPKTMAKGWATPVRASLAMRDTVLFAQMPDAI